MKLIVSWARLPVVANGTADAASTSRWHEIRSGRHSKEMEARQMEKRCRSWVLALLPDGRKTGRICGIDETGKAQSVTDRK